MSHRNDIKLLSLFAMIALCLCSFMVILEDSNDSDATLGTYTGGENLSSESDPYTAIDFNAAGSPIRLVANGIYVLKGSSVSIPEYSYNNDFNHFYVNSITSGFGLTLTDGSVSGTVTKTGTITVGESFRLQGNPYATATATIYVVEDTTPVTSVSISGSSVVNVGSTLTLTATTSPTSATDRGVTWSITSGSSHVSYTTTTTSSGGTIKLTGLSAGSVTVKATASDGSGKYATKTITVNQPTYKYYLYYDMNGGSGGPSTQYETATDTTSTVTTQISTVEPTRSGYTFLGWAKTSTATKATYSPGDYVNVTYDDLTLYAVWKTNSITYTLSFSANGGSGAPSSMSGTTTSTSYTFTIPATEPSRSGYTFRGWSTSSSATSASYTSGNTIIISSNTTLYAVWYQNLSATSTPSVSGVVGQQYSYTVATNVAGCTISVSGASWLSVSGTTVSGIPTSPGTYDITITIIKSGSYVSGTQSFTLKVYSAMGFESVPSASGIFAYAM